MARNIETSLYQTLIDSQFSFLERGERTIIEIYDTVKAQFPHLCDDEYSCTANCKHGSMQPEWNHTVRRALQILKSVDGRITHTGSRGFWFFN